MKAALALVVAVALTGASATQAHPPATAARVHHCKRQADSGIDRIRAKGLSCRGARKIANRWSARCFEDDGVSTYVARSVI